MLDISNSVPQVKLTDFGDARHIYNNYYVHTTASDPEFLSPEIVAGTPVGLISDIWYVFCPELWPFYIVIIVVFLYLSVITYIALS